jgi:hypothetical protein
MEANTNSKLELPYRRKIEPVDLKNYSIIEWRHANLILERKYFRYRLSYIMDEPKNEYDEDCEERKETDRRMDITIKRNRISSIQKYYIEDSDCWKVVIIPFGVSQDINVFFATEDEAKDLYNVLFEYAFK